MYPCSWPKSRSPCGSMGRGVAECRRGTCIWKVQGRFREGSGSALRPDVASQSVGAVPGPNAPAADGDGCRRRSSGYSGEGGGGLSGAVAAGARWWRRRRRGWSLSRVEEDGSPHRRLRHVLWQGPGGGGRAAARGVQARVVSVASPKHGQGREGLLGRAAAAECDAHARARPALKLHLRRGVRPMVRRAPRLPRPPRLPQRQAAAAAGVGAGAQRERRPLGKRASAPRGGGARYEISQIIAPGGGAVQRVATQVGRRCGTRVEGMGLRKSARRT